MKRLAAPVGALQLLILVPLLTLVGCSSAEPRFPVSGTITINGKPLDDATLIFTPVGQGLAGAAEIVEGKFACAEIGGPSAGQFYVRISPNEAELEEVAEDLSQLASKRRKPRVPIKYQRIGGLQVEITGQANQSLKLDLEG